MRTAEECYEYVMVRLNELAVQRRKRHAIALKTVAPVCGLAVIAGGIFVVRNDRTDISNSSHFVENSTENIENTPNVALVPPSSTMTKSHTLPETDNTLGSFFYVSTDVDDYPDFSVVSDDLQRTSFIGRKEVYEYYGIEKLVTNLVYAGFVEDTASDTSYRINTFSDGSVVDYNTFYFSSSRNGIEIKVDIGKDFEFGQDYYTEFNETEISDTKVYIYHCAAEDVYFALFKYNDCSIMVSAKASSIDVDTTKVEGWLFFNTLSTMLGGKYGLGTGGDTPS